MSELRRLVLHDLHLRLGARMVPYAGHEMPVQYAAGVMKEHLHTRERAGLFDVSHMGQVILRPKTGGMEALALALERLVPADVLGLKPGRQRYGLFTNEAGGILDDFMFANRGDHYLLVVNASRKAHDFALLADALADEAVVEVQDTRCLFALQGPRAEEVLTRILPDVKALKFMDSVIMTSDHGELWIARGGYTGEDGFEISVSDDNALALAERLLADDDVAPVGLGARDSLRLEAGLCLYGNDIDETVSPVEAGLSWAIQKVRRRGGAREGGFPGVERIFHELAEGPARVRVGLRPEGRAPMREGTPLLAAGAEDDAAPIGHVTSGGFGPSVGAPIAMGYVTPDHAAIDTAIDGDVRGRRRPARIVAMPFHSTHYKR